MTDTRSDRIANRLRVVDEAERANPAAAAERQQVLPGLDAVIRATLKTKQEKDAYGEAGIVVQGLLKFAAGQAAATAVKLRRLQNAFEDASAKAERAAVACVEAETEEASEAAGRQARLTEIAREAARDRLREHRRTSNALATPAALVAKVAKTAADRNLHKQVGSLEIEGMDEFDEHLEGGNEVH